MLKALGRTARDRILRGDRRFCQSFKDGTIVWFDPRGPGLGTGVPVILVALIEIELPRALRRTDPGLLPDVPELIAGGARYEVDDIVRTAARACPDPELRSLGRVVVVSSSVRWLRPCSGS